MPTVECLIEGKPLSIETGTLAKQAGGACVVRYGDSIVLGTGTVSDKPREGVDFLPLVVDYEVIILEVIQVILEDMGYEVHVFSDPVEGEKAAVAGDYDLILLDVRMPGKNGAELTAAIMEARPDAKILIITAFPTDPLAAEAMDAGALALLKKPFEIAKIVDFLGDS